MTRDYSERALVLLVICSYLTCSVAAQELGIDVQQVMPNSISLNSNHAVIEQNGLGHWADVEQKVTSGLESSPNTASILQGSGSNNFGSIVQHGQNDTAMIGQFGSNLKTEVIQSGSGLGVTVNQYGVGDGQAVTVTQTGPGAPVVGAKP